jgi:hypothetical protein
MTSPSGNDHLRDLVAGQRLVLEEPLREPVEVVALLGQDALGRLVALVHDPRTSASIFSCVSGLTFDGPVL